MLLIVVCCFISDCCWLFVVDYRLLLVVVCFTVCWLAVDLLLIGVCLVIHCYLWCCFLLLFGVVLLIVVCCVIFIVVWCCIVDCCLLLWC